MGRLAVFNYQKVVKKLEKLGFSFDRQAADSHETWYNSSTDRSNTIPNHHGDLLVRNTPSNF